ncbi:hypothetical protein L195_g057753, partial [Trifolium pratense]
MEQNHAALRVDVDDMKEKMDKMFELMQNMANKPQPVVNQPWPTYGLPPGYVPPEDDSNGPPPPPLVPVAIPVINGGNNSQGVSTGPNGDASHATEDVQLGCPTPNQATVVIAHSEDESTQKYKVLEERLRA